MTKETTVKLEQEIGRLLGDKVTFNLENRARYRLFRRYYMAGVSAYLTYMMIVEFYETNGLLNEEAEILNEMATLVHTSIWAIFRQRPQTQHQLPKLMSLAAHLTREAPAHRHGFNSAVLHGTWSAVAARVLHTGQ